MHDFEPYFCTVVDCPTPFDVPNSFIGLLDHMQSHVHIGLDVFAHDSQHEPFPKTESADHQKASAEVANKDGNSMRRAYQARSAYLFNDCPFCGGYPDVIETIYADSETIEAQEALRKHIKHHMQQIALFFPPDRADCHDDLENDTKASDVSIRRSDLDDIPENLEDFVQVCGRAACDCTAGQGALRGEPTPILLNTTEEHSREARWTCCQCHNNFSLDGKKSCPVAKCNNHDPQGCGRCDVYERDGRHEGDWSYILSDPSLDSRSCMRAEDLATDVRLQSFVLHAEKSTKTASEDTHVERGLENAVRSQPLVNDRAYIQDDAVSDARKVRATEHAEKREEHYFPGTNRPTPNIKRPMVEKQGDAQFSEKKPDHPRHRSNVGANAVSFISNDRTQTIGTVPLSVLAPLDPQGVSDTLERSEPGSHVLGDPSTSDRAEQAPHERMADAQLRSFVPSARGYGTGAGNHTDTDLYYDDAQQRWYRRKFSPATGMRYMHLLMNRAHIRQGRGSQNGCHVDGIPHKRRRQLHNSVILCNPILPIAMARLAVVFLRCQLTRLLLSH